MLYSMKAKILLGGKRAVPEAYRELEDFYDAIDSVYVASPHDTHYEYIKSALKHGKHVLCEKPMVLQKEQAEELFCDLSLDVYRKIAR